GGGGDDDGVDVLDLQLGFREQFARDLFQKVDRVLDEQFRAVDPAMALIVPVQRYARVSFVDAGVHEYRHETLDMADFLEQLPRPVRRRGLVDRKGRHSGFQRKQTRFHKAISSITVAPLSMESIIAPVLRVTNPPNPPASPICRKP